jgi:tetratricopeptide (TPR) repeat protein
LYYFADRRVEAASLFGKAIELFEAYPPPDSTIFIAALTNVAVIHLQQGQKEDATNHLVRALEIIDAVERVDAPSAAGVAESLAELLQSRDSCAAAAEYWDRAVVYRSAFIGPPTLPLARALTGRGLCHMVEGEWEAAEADLAVARGYYEMLFGRSDIRVASSIEHLAQLNTMRKQYGKAQQLAEEALQIVQTQVAASDPRLGVAQLYLATIYLESGQLSQAEITYNLAIGVLEKAGPDFRSKLIDALNGMLEVYQATGRENKVQEIVARLANMAMEEL